MALPFYNRELCYYENEKERYAGTYLSFYLTPVIRTGGLLS